ncbi:helix-turn-helix domain-containing protein [Flagellimonas aequoris]|nr:AraC family transcriptional regulator [Allomuricauda aequoris]
MLILSFLSGIAIPGGLLLGAYFYFIRKENRLKLGLLAMLFAALAIRCSKSFFCFSLNLPDMGMAISYLGLACIGPITWLYISNAPKAEFKTLRKQELLHFLPSLLGFVAITFYGKEFAVELYMYTTYLMLVYLLISWGYMIKHSNKITGPLFKWNIILLTTVTLFCLIFLFQYYTNELLHYTIASGVSSFLFYALFFISLKTPILFPKKKPVQKGDPEVIQKVNQAIKKEKIYRVPSLTLDKFSKELGFPSYLVSRTIRAEYEKSFSEFINHLRVQEVIEKLPEREQEHHKIEGLAYSAGFNTPSTFYAAFKKVTGMSPTEYEEQFFGVDNLVSQS